MKELKRYLGHFLPHWPLLLFATVLMSLMALVPGAVVLLFEQLLEDILKNSRTDRLGQIAAAIGGIYLLSGGLTLWRTWLTKRIAWRVTTELRERLHQATFVLSTDQQATTGERISAATHDVDELQYGSHAGALGVATATGVVLPRTTRWQVAA